MELSPFVLKLNKTHAKIEELFSSGLTVNSGFKSATRWVILWLAFKKKYSISIPRRAAKSGRDVLAEVALTPNPVDGKCNMLTELEKLASQIARGEYKHAENERSVRTRKRRRMPPLQHASPVVQVNREGGS
jgi:hypothetical protein